MVTISVCMIVKNEEAVLARCLESLKGLYDELIIVDTGSNDGTKEIAAKYNAQLFDFAWCDDFAKARNFAFSKCNMDYIYSADADEVIDEENRVKFYELKENLLPEIEIVQMLYINRHEYATTENFEIDLRPKLFKRLRTFNWIEPIHEMVNLNPVVYDSDVEILHMPTSLHSGRDLSIFRKALLNSENGILSKRLTEMYARELIKSGSENDLSEAVDFFEMVWYNQKNYSGLQNESCCVLAKAYRQKGIPSEFFKWALKNITDSPCSEICIELARFYMDCGDLFEAIDWCEKAINATSPILDSACGNKTPYQLLADIYAKLAMDENVPAFCDFQDKASEYQQLADES